MVDELKVFFEDIIWKFPILARALVCIWACNISPTSTKATKKYEGPSEARPTGSGGSPPGTVDFPAQRAKLSARLARLSFGGTIFLRLSFFGTGKPPPQNRARFTRALSAFVNSLPPYYELDPTARYRNGHSKFNDQAGHFNYRNKVFRLGRKKKKGSDRMAC
jgi:hypothetical protein